MKKNSSKKRASSLLYIIIFLVFAANNSFSQAYKVRIAIVGNSITFGAGLTNRLTENYPSQLDSMLSEIYNDTCEIQNFGVSGRTMMRKAESPLWAEPLFKNALKYVPDICVILLGTNDSKPYRWDTWGNEFLGDYLAMIDTFKYRNPETQFIVCYPPPIWEGHPYGDTFENSHNDSVVEHHIIPAINSVVSKTGAILVDFHTPFSDSVQLFPDKLHPGAEGSAMMAKILFDTIIKNNLIEKVDVGKTFVSVFEQKEKPVPVGGNVELEWSTIFADSVFLDGVLVEKEGTKTVLAEKDKVYTLTTKNSKNTTDLLLQLETYTPEKHSLEISYSSYNYSKGIPVVLYATYIDQYKNVMTEKTSNITWSFLEGEGEFGDHTDTSIVFVPTVTGKVTIEARVGDIAGEKVLLVSSLSSINTKSTIAGFTIYPNPARETLTISIDKPASISIMNPSGVVVKQIDLTNQQKIQLDISGFGPGVYFVMDTGNNAVQKIRIW